MEARERILDATVDLLGERGTGAVRIDDIADTAGVGKQTIYRWWPSKTAVIVDALLTRSKQETPFPDTGDAYADLRQHLRGVARLFRSPLGQLIREVLAEAPGDPGAAQDFLDRFWQPRRELSRDWLARAVASGAVRPGLDAEATLDTIYSPFWARLVVGHQPIALRLVDDVLRVVWPGLAGPGGGQLSPGQTRSD